MIFIYLIFVVCLNIGWLIRCAITCVKLITKYKECKRTPNLHPIYRDVQYLSQQRKLYNLETHFVKNVLIFMCIAVEIIGMFGIAIIGLVDTMHIKEYSKFNSTIVAIEIKYPNCSINSIMENFYFLPSSIILHNIEGFLLMFILILLSILTRYLAARYLKHSFHRTLRKYIILSSVQFIIIVGCSTIYTIICSFILFPVLLIINWVILFKDSQFLSRVLKSNLKEIELHTNNKTLFREQLLAYKFYCFFQKLMFFSISALVLGVSLFNLYYLVVSFYDSFCLLNLIYGFNISSNTPRSSHDKFGVEVYLHQVCVYILLLYSISSSLPLLSITIFPIIRGCIKRYRSRYYVYRYNYDNISHFRQ